MERAKELSSDDNPPLMLPGLESQDARPATSTSESLGEIARKARPKNTQSRSQRIFTDDDVVHGTSTASVSVANSADFGNRVQNAQKLIDTWANKTPRELSDGVAGETKSPGREAWEQRLYVQKGKMIGAVQVTLDAAHKIVHASASEERTSARRATDKLLADLDRQRTLYDQLVAEGVKRASEWERLHR